MNTIETQKKTVNKVLALINKHIDPEAVVCGGAPRNWIINEKPANDIDLYLRIFQRSSKNKNEQL